MEYRRLGRTGLKVSEISLGTWLTCNDLRDKSAAAKIISRAYDLGINFFDTADVYSGGNAEVLLGEALAAYSRDSYVLATKVYWPMGSGPNERGLSRKHILSECDRSLQRLGVDYIDLYYCHWFDIEVPVDETLRAMSDLVRWGKVLYVGVSNWTAAQIADGLGIVDHYSLAPIAANQSSYNMFDRYLERDTMPLCSSAGVGLVVYSPLAQGVLTGKYRKGETYPKGSRAANPGISGAVTVRDYIHDDILESVDSLLPIANDLGLSLSQLALAWTLRRPEVSSALIGASKTDQIDENVKASRVEVPEEALARIEGILGACRVRVKHNVVEA